MPNEFDKKVIRPQSRVVMHFSLTLEDGTIAESTFDSDPLEFVMGDGTLIEGLELALYGLKPGDRQRLTMQPQDAFGFRDPENIHIMPRSEFAADMELEPGLIIGFTTPSGEEIPGAVLEVQDDEVKVDFNHPLAGHELIFDVEILEVQSSPPTE
jgi:FKBP-type peptidyl-prolyl cis-trans isomerase SlpA